MTAAWIAPDGAKDKKNCYFRARKIFEVDEIPGNVMLTIAAESSYILYLNGKEMGRGPARGTHAINYHDAYPVASELKIGKNEIGVLCHCMNIETFVAAPAEPALLVEIPGLLQTDSTWQVADAGDEWKKDVTLYTVQTGFSEWRDLRKEPVGWEIFADSSSWEPALCIGPASGIFKKQLLPRGISHLQDTVYLPVAIPASAGVPKAEDYEDREVARLMDNEKHRSTRSSIALSHITPDGGGMTIAPEPDGGGVAIVFDFGREIVGRFEMWISGSAGAVVDIGHEEQLTGRRLRVSHEDAKGERYDFADRYILRDGFQQVGNTLMERGFRLVQVVVRDFDVPITIHRVQAIDRRYPLGPRADFQCSDSLLNGIWDACVETLSACTTDIFTDCPWRERSFWVNDLLVENVISLQLSGDRRLPARALQMAFSEAASNGLVNGVCPCPVAGKKDDWLALPATNLFLVLILRDYLFYTGDVSLVREYLPKLRRILDHFEDRSDLGLISFPPEYWNFFDWSYEANGRSLSGKTSAPLNYLFLIALRAYDELALHAGVATEPNDLSARLASLADAFYDPASRRLSDDIEDGKRSASGSQLSHALALLAEESSGGMRATFEEGMNDPDLLVPELYLHHFIFLAQKKIGRTENGLERIRKYWGDIVAKGSPTIWEFGVYNPGKGALDGKGSLCHGFATSPVDFFQTVILGITPRQPGFAEFSVDPCAFDLESAAGRIPTPSGDIVISWHRSSTGLSVTLEVPEGCEAITPDNRRFGPGNHRFETQHPPACAE